MAKTTYSQSVTNQNSVQLDSAAEESFNRGALYSFLGETYCARPDQKFLESLKSGRFFEALSAFEAARPFVEDFQRRVEHLTEGDLEDELGVEFTRLFVGPGAGYVPPYESVFKDRWTIQFCGCPDAGLIPTTKVLDGLLWGDSTVAVENSYHKAGFKLTEAWRGTPDHIGLELQFMGELCRREGEAWQAGDVEAARAWLGKEKAFLGEHLASWVERFCAKVLERACHPYYKLVATVTLELTRCDYDELCCQNPELENAAESGT